MAIEFDKVKETVKALSLRLDSPNSDYSFIFSESDEAVEVRVEIGDSLEPLFVFVVDAERFRVVKDLDIDPNGYVTLSYHSYLELLSYVFEYFYPVYYKLNNGAAMLDMVSKVLGEKIRIWKDLLRVICKSGEVEYYDLGGSFTVLDVNFTYDLNSFNLYLSGGLSETYKCRTVMELVCTLLTILAYMFQNEDLDINPILGDGMVDQGDDDFGFDEMVDTMELGDEIDGMGGGAMGEDLESEFEPAGDSAESTTPDLGEGKDQILEETNASFNRRKADNKELT